MAAGFRDLLAFMLRWKSAKTATLPWYVASGQVWHTGATCGKTWHTGTECGQVFITGKTTGQIHG